MHILKRSCRYLHVTGVGLSLVLSSGCITISSDAYKNSIAYEPVQSSGQIDASARIEAVDTMSPEMRSTWKRWMNNDATIANYMTAIGQAMHHDLATSGLFSRIVPNGAPADYHVKALCLESVLSDYRVRITLTATETATGVEVSSHTREHSFGTSMFSYKMKEALPALLTPLKAELLADLQRVIRQRQEQTALAEAELLTNAPLAQLLASVDKSVAAARIRNRALVAAKNQQLPAILRENKTNELSTLVIKIEQTILDLNHECEVTKDQAQQSFASGTAEGAGRNTRGASASAAPSSAFDELRGLAICYRERIELLKPMLAALKEEITNRNR